METTRHKVDLRYTQRELLALFDTAEREDVEKGGRYDKRGGAINVWSHHWANAATRHDSETIGTFYVQSDLRNLYVHFEPYARIVTVILLASCLVAFLLATRLQREISEPVLELVGTAKKISQTHGCRA